VLNTDLDGGCDQHCRRPSEVYDTHRRTKSTAHSLWDIARYWLKIAVFTARAVLSAVLGVVILSVRHTRALWLIRRTYLRYFYTTRKGNHSSFLMPKISAKFQRGSQREVGRLKRWFSTNIPGTADRLRRCQLSSPVSVINFWRSAAMLITSTVEICIQHLGRVEEMAFAARHSYASAVLMGVIILSVCPCVCLSHACFVTNPKNLPVIFLYHMKGQSF